MHCASCASASGVSAPSRGYPPMVCRSLSNTIGCPSGGTCTAPSGIPSEIIGAPWYTSCGPNNRMPMRSARLSSVHSRLNASNRLVPLNSPICAPITRSSTGFGANCGHNACGTSRRGALLPVKANAWCLASAAPWPSMPPSASRTTVAQLPSTSSPRNPPGAARYARTPTLGCFRVKRCPLARAKLRHGASG